MNEDRANQYFVRAKTILAHRPKWLFYVFIGIVIPPLVYWITPFSGYSVEALIQFALFISPLGVLIGILATIFSTNKLVAVIAMLFCGLFYPVCSILLLALYIGPEKFIDLDRPYALSMQVQLGLLATTSILTLLVGAVPIIFQYIVLRLFGTSAANEGCSAVPTVPPQTQ